jgi:hypothetical protein
MRGLRRHEEKHGLADDRRTLINRYMVELADSPEPDEAPPAEEPPERKQHLTGLVVLEPEAVADPAPAPDLTPAPIVFHTVPPPPEQREGGEISVSPGPEQREGGEVSVDAFRQTLEHVERLSAQLAAARNESSRWRAQLAMHR